MVNKCSAIGCKSLYSKEKSVKLHRFPLINNETLPKWIAATGREKEWKPCKSSRLCGNHFRESEYIIGHGKGVLKSSAVPTIDYRVDIPKYQKKKNTNTQINKQLKIEQMEINQSFEIVQLDYNDIVYHSNYELQNKITNVDSYNNNKESVKKDCKETNINEEFIMNHNFTNYNNDEYNETEDNKSENTMNKYANSIEEIRNEICNRENQCYMFTSNFYEDTDSIILTTPEDRSLAESSIMNIDQTTADLNFNKIMALKIKKQRRTQEVYSLFFKEMAKPKSLKKDLNYSYNPLYDETKTFGAFIETQMKELRPYRKIYLATKHKIQKVLMKAQLKITH